MESSPASPGLALERFRAYLRLLAELHLGRRPGSARLDPSDVVQQTMMEAYRDRGRFAGRSDDELAAWLRRLLACNLADAARAAGRAKRDMTRERSLEAALDASSARLGSLLAADQTSPSQGAMRNEAALRLAGALERLPEANRRALVMRHCQGMGVAEIAQQLGRTPAAVAGLLKRGLAQLRDLLPEGGE